MNRQNIRKMLLIIAMLLFPITIWYMSPYLIMQGAMEGIMTGSFVVFAAMLVGSLFFGRLFCGWLCPMGGLQECLSAVNDKVPKQGWKNNIKYVIWGLWITAVVLCFGFRKGEIRLDPLYMTDHGISVAEIGNYIIYYGVIILVFVPAVLFGKRIFCHYFCWMAPFMVIGGKISRLLHLPHLHIAVKPGACVDCHACEKNCPMGIRITETIKAQTGMQTGTNERDRDALGGNKLHATFPAECITCGACVDTCKKDVLSFAFSGEGSTVTKERK